MGREGRGHSRGRGRGGRGRGRGGRSSKAGNNATIGIPSPYSIYIPREKCTVDNCANPPIAKYLEELANDDSALENVRSSARNALASVLKYPNKIRSQEDALELYGVGPTLSRLIVEQVEGGGSDGLKGSSRFYIPAIGSGAYAILVTLLGAHEDQRPWMNKLGLQHEAQPLSEKSFTQPAPGSRYTAWAGMTTLTCKKLVEKFSNPAKYKLLPGGLTLAGKLRDAHRALSSSRSSVITAARSQGRGQGNSAAAVTQRSTPRPSKRKMVDSFSLPHKRSNAASLTPNTVGFVKPKPPVCRDISSSPLPLPPATAAQVPLVSSSQSPSFGKDTPGHGDYEIILCVDSAEKRSIFPSLEKASQEDDVYTRLRLYDQENSFRVEKRPLKVGDYLWICRPKSAATAEFVLGDCIVERKRSDDLRHSLHSGHLHEQLWRFGNVGITDPILLVEKGGAEVDTSDVSKFEQLCANAQIHNRFTIHKTGSEEDTVGFLLIKSNEYLRLVNHAFVRRCCKRSFAHLQEAGKKSPTLTATQLLTKSLIQIANITYTKALAITSQYPTLMQLMDAVEDDRWLSTPGVGDYAKKVIAELYSTDRCV